MYLLLALSPFMSVAPLIACLRANHRRKGRRVPRLLGPDQEPAKETGATLIQMGRWDGDDPPPPLDAAEEAEAPDPHLPAPARPLGEASADPLRPHPS